MESLAHQELDSRGDHHCGPHVVTALSMHLLSRKCGNDSSSLFVDPRLCAYSTFSLFAYMKVKSKEEIK